MNSIPQIWLLKAKTYQGRQFDTQTTNIIIKDDTNSKFNNLAKLKVTWKFKLNYTFFLK